VAICGGHALKRADPQYQTLVELGNRIATSGFICATGGGPGAMEASNLGAYIAGLQHCRSVEDLSAPARSGHPEGLVEVGTALDEVCVEDTQPRMRRSSSGEGMFVDTTASAVARISAERLCLREDPPMLSPHRENCTRRDIARAMELIRSFPVTDDRPEYQNSRPAEAVIEEFGLPRHYTPSIGIPTWRYGHEPPNLFTAYHAKFFQNSIREDILLQICFGGLIITPGGPGTMQEIFQAACINAYSREGYDYPMVFLGVQFWTDNGIWDLVCRQAAGRPYAKLLLLSDSVDEVMDHLLQCARMKGLRLIYDISELSNPYWYSRELFEEDEASALTTSNV
jgi:predicted Rossmann-fold nucleotide-binding protein